MSASSLPKTEINKKMEEKTQARGSSVLSVGQIQSRF